MLFTDHPQKDYNVKQIFVITSSDYKEYIGPIVGAFLGLNVIHDKHMKWHRKVWKSFSVLSGWMYVYKEP